MRKIPKVKFVKREETNYIHIIEKDLGGRSYLDLYREAWQRGDFDVDFHFLLHYDGAVEKGRDIDAVGSFLVNPEEDSVVIYVDTLGGRETEEEKGALASLVERLSQKYPGAQPIKIVE